MSETAAVRSRALVAALREYRAIDYLTQGYLVFVALLILVFHDDSVTRWPLYLLAHALTLAAVHGLIQLHARRGGGFLDMLRGFYPLILYTFFYIETHKLLFMFVSRQMDGFFIGIDQALFGLQPSRALMQWLPYWWVSEPMYLSYFSYYWMVFGTAMGLYLLRRERFARYVMVVSFVFYACYVTYIFLPVLGPYDDRVTSSQQGNEALISARPIPESIAAGPFYNVMRIVYKVAESRGGAAFPSSHVAVAVATACFTWRYLRRVRVLHLIFVVLLSLSTVYCGYHYAIDVIGGVLTAALLVPVGDRLYDRTRHLGPPEPAPS